MVKVLVSSFYGKLEMQLAVNDQRLIIALLDMCSIYILHALRKNDISNSFLCHMSANVPNNCLREVYIVEVFSSDSILVENLHSTINQANFILCKHFDFLPCKQFWQLEN